MYHSKIKRTAISSHSNHHSSVVFIIIPLLGVIIVNIILLSSETNTVCWLYLVYGTMSFLCIFVCVSVCFVLSVSSVTCAVINSLSQESSRTPRLRISLGTPRKGRHPLDSCRSESVDQRLSHCHRRNSTLPSLLCFLSYLVSGDRCGKPKNNKIFQLWLPTCPSQTWQPLSTSA